VVSRVFDSFLSFLKKFDERKTHNMLTLMLDPRFFFLLMSSFIGNDQGMAIVEQYDIMSLYLMLMKCYYHLHSSTKSNNGFANKGVDDDNNLDIFQLITNSTKLAKELFKEEMLIFQCYQVDVKEIKCPLQWWEKHEAMFQTIGFLVRQILGIVGSQIDIEKIFSLVEILTNLRRCHLQLENLENLFFVNKNWSNDCKVGCTSPSNLLELIRIYSNLEEELKQFGGVFEKNEIVKFINC
jgi:hypothetical protein